MDRWSADEQFCGARTRLYGVLGKVGVYFTIDLKPHVAPLFAWSSVTSRGTVGRLPETIILTLEYIETEPRSEPYLVSTKRPHQIGGERFRTDAKCADGFSVIAGWELQTRRWFALRIIPADAPYLFKEDGSSQWASTTAELLASLAALHVFGWLIESKDRRSLDLALTAGTDNRANESLTSKRSTTKWPLMAVNMQLSSSLAKARTSLSLRWRPREQNVEADQLTTKCLTDFPWRIVWLSPYQIWICPSSMHWLRHVPDLLLKGKSRKKLRRRQ